MHERLCDREIPNGAGGESTRAADGAVGGAWEFDVKGDERGRVEGYSVKGGD